MPAHRTVTVDQFKALLNYMDQDADLATGSTIHNTRAGEDRQERNRKWEKVATLLNAMEGCTKTPTNWRKYWNEKKYTARKKAKYLNESTKSTYTGDLDTHTSRIVLTNFEKRILSALGQEQDTSVFEESEFQMPFEDSSSSSSSHQNVQVETNTVPQKLEQPSSPELPKPPTVMPPLQPARQPLRFKLSSTSKPPEHHTVRNSNGMSIRVFSEPIKSGIPSKPRVEERPSKSYENETQWAMRLEERKLSIEMEKAKALRDIASAITSTRQDITGALSELQRTMNGLKYEMTTLKETIDARMPYFEINDQS